MPRDYMQDPEYGMLPDEMPIEEPSVVRPGFDYDTFGDWAVSGGQMGGDLFPRNEQEALFFRQLANQHFGEWSQPYHDYASQNFGTQSPGYLEEASLAQTAGPMAMQDDQQLYDTEQAKLTRQHGLNVLGREHTFEGEQGRLDRQGDIDVANLNTGALEGLRRSQAGYYDAAARSAGMPRVPAATPYPQTEMAALQGQLNETMVEIARLQSDNAPDSVLMPLRRRAAYLEESINALIPDDPYYVDPDTILQQLEIQGLDPEGGLTPVNTPGFLDFLGGAQDPFLDEDWRRGWDPTSPWPG